MKTKFYKIFIIFTLIVATLLAYRPTIQVVFAQDNSEFTITNYQLNVADIDNYNYINIFGDNINILSTELHKLCYVKSETVKSFSNYGTNDGQITAPQFLKRISNQLAIYDINRIQVFDLDFNYIKRFAYINNEPLPLALGTVVSMSADYSGNIYMLDKTNNLILKLNTSNDIIEKLEIVTQQITINDNSKISVNANGNKLALINCSESNFVYNSTNQTSQTINNEGYNDVLFDCMDNLFLFKKTDNTTQISKYECDNYTTPITKNLNLTYTSLDIDIETGKLYFLNEQVYLIENEQFFSNASTEISPVDIKSTLAHDTALDVCKTQNNAKLYSTCVSFASSIVLTDNTKVVVLQKEMPQNKNMTYCLVTHNNTELTGYIESQNLIPILKNIVETPYKTICQNVNIYSYPSLNAGVVKTINLNNQILTVVGNTCDYINSNNQSYYEVKIDDKIAYVEQRFLVKTDLVEIQKTDVAPIETNYNQFIAMVLAVTCLFVVTLFVCVFLFEKSKDKN